jgi:hypothetical protein
MIRVDPVVDRLSSLRRVGWYGAAGVSFDPDSAGTCPVCVANGGDDGYPEDPEDDPGPGTRARAGGDAAPAGLLDSAGDCGAEGP